MNAEFEKLRCGHCGSYPHIVYMKGVVTILECIECDSRTELKPELSVSVLPASGSIGSLAKF